MTDYAVHHMPICQTQFLINNSAPTTQVLDAADDGVAAFFIAPKTGSITGIGSNITAKAGTAPTYRFAIEGIANDADEPDGTIKGVGNSAYVDAADPATGFAWRTLGTALSVTAGDKLAVTIRYTGSSTIDASNCVTVALRLPLLQTSTFFPYCATLTGGTWASVSYPPCVCVRYSDGYVPISMCAYSALATESWSTSVTAGRYRGTKWTPPFDCRCVGVNVAARFAATTDFNVKVFSGTNTTPVATVAVEPDECIPTFSNYGVAMFYLPAFTMTAGTIYRFVVEPTTTNAITGLGKVTFPTGDTYAHQALYGDLKTAYGTSGGTPDPEWTGESDDAVYMVVPVIDQISVTTSGYNLPIIGSGLVY